MNPIHRKILDQHRKEIVQDLILTDDFRAELCQTDLFPEGTLDLIMAEKTRGGRTFKMLELLPTRGPKAFDTFLSIVEKDYPWLRESLQADLDKEMVDQHSHHAQAHKSTDHDTESHNVRSKAASFLHKKFGQSRKISEKDKRAIEKFMADCVQEERALWKQELESQARNNAESTLKGMVDISSKLEILNLKLKMCLTAANQDDDDDDEETHLKMKSHQLKPEDAILDLDQNINTVRERLKVMTSDREKCFEITRKDDSNEDNVNAKNLAAASLYKDVAKMKRQYERKIREILKEKEAVVSQLKEQTDELMSDNIDLIEARNEQIDQLGQYQKEMYSLQMRNDKLEEKFAKQDEKNRELSKTIETLKAQLNALHKNRDKQGGVNGNQSYWQAARNQRPVLASQRTKRKVLSRVNSTYLTDTSKPQNKTTKTE